MAFGSSISAVCVARLIMLSGSLLTSRENSSLVKISIGSDMVLVSERSGVLVEFGSECEEWYSGRKRFRHECTSAFKNLYGFFNE